MFRPASALVVLVSLLGAAPAGAPAQPAGQPENPVFVNDSPAAAETLARVQDHLKSGNIEQAVRLLQRLLDENADALVASPDDGALYVPVRQRVHEALLSDRALLARYREAQGPVARDLVRSGRHADAERTSLFTADGFEAALRLAQQHFQEGSFGAAVMTLDQLDRHPDRAGDNARRAAELACEIARYAHRDTATDLARRWAAGAGLGDADLSPAPLPPAVLNPARSALAPSGPIDPAGVVARPLWSAPYGEEVPVEAARFAPNVNPETLPQFGRELRAFPAVAGDSLYVVGDRFVSAFNRFTLEPRWKVDAIAAAGIDTDPWDREAAANRGMRRASQGSLEDIASVSVRGGTVIACIGLEPPGAGEGQELLIAIDAASGAVRWTRTVQTLDAALVRTHVRGPVLIDGRTAVVGCRKWQPDRRLTALYLLGLDVETGSVRWLSLVGSAGSLPFYRQPQVADGGALDDGVVYRTDRLGLVAAYEAQSGRPRWVRRFGSEPTDTTAVSNSWQMSLPVLRGPWLYTVAPDRSGVARLDRATGRLDGLIPADRLAGPAYLLTVGPLLACVSENRVATVPFEADGPWAQRPVRLSPVVPAPGLRGRVAVAGDRLLAPVTSGLLVIDSASPTEFARTIDLDTSGNPMACDDQLIVADDARLHSYLSWDKADAILTQRVGQSPDDPTPAVILAELSYRAGKAARLLFAVDAAAGAIGRAADPDRAEVQRRRLFDAVASMVETALGSAPAGPGPAEHAAPALDAASARDLIDRLGPLARRPEESAAQLLLAGRAQADSGQSAQAAASFQQVLADRRLASASWNSGRGLVRAADEATRRLEQVVATAGRGAYGAFDAEAEAAMAQLPPAAGADAMELIAHRYPVARSTPAMWIRIAAAYRDGGRARAEARALEVGLQRAEGMPDASPAVVGELAGRLVTNLKQRGLLVAAGTVLQRFGARFPSATLTIDGRPADLTRLRSEVGAELLAQRRWPSAGAPAAAGAQLVTSWTLMEPEIRPTSPVAPPFVVMQAEDGRVALWGVQEPGAPLAPLWTSDAPKDPVALVKTDRTSAYFFWATPAGGVITRVDAASRAVVFRSEPFNGYFPPGGPATAPNPNDRMRTPLDGVRSVGELLATADERTLALVERTGRAVILDADTGAVLWAGLLPLTRIADCDLIASVLVVAGDRERRGPGGAVVESTPALAAVDARSGREMRQIDSPGGPVRWLRLTDAGDLVAGVQSAVASFDLETGALNWKIGQGSAATTIDAWVVGDRLLVLGEDRTLWQVSVASGVVGAASLDTRGRFDTSSHVYGAATAEGGIAFRSPQGVVVFDARGELRGTDAIGATDNLVPPAPSDAGFVTISMAGTAVRDADGQSLFTVYTLGPSGVLKTSTTVQLGAVPSRVGLLDGRLLISAGRHTAVYVAPAP
ncbi:MAG: PQQ-binding-like beta-propeller repeat protein [Phycisphaeraceae bacterium]|nr:PQQ-binding-like beta-propeller repeat protein [Phycisphaeraceae bacterium]